MCAWFDSENGIYSLGIDAILPLDVCQRVKIYIKYVRMEDT